MWGASAFHLKHADMLLAGVPNAPPCEFLVMLSIKSPSKRLQAEEVREAREAQEAFAEQAAKCQGLGDVGGILGDGIG